MRNLAEILQNNFDVNYYRHLVLAGQVADSMNCEVFLVGGAVRDVLLGNTVNDIDLVVVGDSEDFANQLANKLGGEITARSQFLTAKISFPDFSIDVASARRDDYPYPGSLPKVRLVRRIEKDLRRRDISINAMAISINRNTWGELIDPINGEDDLHQGKIRILYRNSFRDDPTRMLRVIMYAVRLGFSIDARTEDLISRNLRHLKRMAGWRIFITFKHILRQSSPQKILIEAHNLGLLQAMHSSLDFENVELLKFDRIRDFYGSDHHFVMLSILVSSLSEKDMKRLIRRLRMSGRWIRVINDTHFLNRVLKKNEDRTLTNSKILHLLSRFDIAAVEAHFLCSDIDTLKSTIRLYIDELRFIKPELNGDDLIELGLEEGPKIGKALKDLTTLVVDGELKSRKEEEDFILGVLRKSN